MIRTQTATTELRVSYRRWEWALLAVLIGLHITANGVLNLPGMRLELTPLAPIVAAWVVLHCGPGAVPVLLTYALLPRFGFAMGEFSLFWAPPHWTAMLVGIAAGAWWASRRDPAQWQGLWRSGRWLVAVFAVSVLALGAMEWPAMRLPVDGFGLSVSPANALAILACLWLPKWSAWAAHTRAEGGALMGLVALGLPLLAVWTGALGGSVNIAGFWLAWGALGGFPLALAMLTAGLLSNWPPARVWMALVVLVILLEASRLYAGQPPLAARWIDYGSDARWWPGVPVAVDALCNTLGAILLVGLLRATGPSLNTGAASQTLPSPSPMMKSARMFWLRAWVAALVLLVLPPLVSASQSYFLAQDTRGWLVGTLAFSLAAACGLPALVWIPVGFGALAAAGLLPGATERAIGPDIVHVVGVAALAASWAFAGWLVHRARAGGERAPDEQPIGGAVPIDGLGRLVHRLDVSATLASFGVLLTMLLVVLGLVQSGAMGVLVQSFGSSPSGSDWAEEWPVVALVVLASALAAMLPLSFLLVDAANRSDRMQPVSALAGTALVSLLQGLAALLVGGMSGATTMWLVERGIGPVGLAVLWGAWGSALLAIGLGRLRGTRGGYAVGLVLVLLPSLLWAAHREWDDRGLRVDAAEGAQLMLEALVSLLVLALAAALLLRAVWLRADLALPLPRRWLFGEIPGGGFWPRLAALMGLPASMWRRSALREPAFWLLLLARPLVYLGAGVVLSLWWWLGLALILAGHGSLRTGKALAARAIWRPGDPAAQPHPVLFLRGFDDDQFDFRLRGLNPVKRWLALWSFRRNLDEALVDEVGRYGTVVALGRPGETDTPFGAARHYSRHEDWQVVVLETARRARGIIIAAGNTPGVLWEYEMLRREQLLERTMLLFHPGAVAAEANRASLQAFPLTDKERAVLQDDDAGRWVALIHRDGRWALLTSAEVTPAHYVLALRLHFQGAPIKMLASRAALLPAPSWPALA